MKHTNISESNPFTDKMKVDLHMLCALVLHRVQHKHLWFNTNTCTAWSSLLAFQYPKIIDIQEIVSRMVDRLKTSLASSSLPDFLYVFIMAYSHLHAQ